MGLLRGQYTLRGLMVVIAAFALGMGLVRVDPWLGLVYFLVVLVYPILTTEDVETHSRKLRPDAKRAGLCYLAGVVGPTICLILDPFVFKGLGQDSRNGIFGSSSTYWYGFMGLEMVI